MSPENSGNKSVSPASHRMPKISALENDFIVFESMKSVLVEVMALERATSVVAILTALAWISFQLRLCKGGSSVKMGQAIGWGEDIGMERRQKERKPKRRSSTFIQQYLSNSCSEPGITLHAKPEGEPALKYLIV